jgi:hypothetical protein
MAGFHMVASISSAVMAWLLLNDLLHYKILVIYALVVGTAGAFVMPARDSAVNPVTRVSQRMGHPWLHPAKSGDPHLAGAVRRPGFGHGRGLPCGAVRPWPLFAAQAGAVVIGGVAALFLPRLHSRSPARTSRCLEA